MLSLALAQYMTVMATEEMRKRLGLVPTTIRLYVFGW